MSLFQPVYFPFLCSVLFLFYCGPPRFRPVILLAASYGFIGLFGWRAPVYLISITLVSYVAGLEIARREGAERTQRLILGCSITLILAALAYSKYLNFLLESVLSVLRRTEGDSFNLWTIIAPMGLSYYSFQAIGYLLDIHWGKGTAETSPVRYALFLAYFPKFVSGPIERADTLIPALHDLQDHRFQYAQAKRGLLLIAWGFFLKLVVADNLSVIVSPGYDAAFHRGERISPVYGMLFYLQLYYDFLGYMCAARGSSWLFGIPLRRNFDHPFLATNVQEFWRRWHISLSTWINDYLYFPLRMRYRKLGPRGLYAVLLFTFLVLGLWHGAAWPFVFFGIFHGVAMCFSTWSLPIRDRFWKTRGQLRRPWLIYARRSATFLMVCISMGIFRCESARQVAYLFRGLLTLPGQWMSDLSLLHAFPTALALVFVFAAEIVHGCERAGSLERGLMSGPLLLRWSLYMLVTLVIVFFGRFQTSPAVLYALF